MRKLKQSSVESSVESGVSVRERMVEVMAQLNSTFVGREDAVRAMTLAALTGSNFLLVGPRGTAKTAVAKCFFGHFSNARHMSTLLGSYSTLNDLIGRMDLAALQRGEERRHTEGKLLDVDFAFLDEALKGSDGVLNSLLGLLGEGRDFDGEQTNLWFTGSATNWPEVHRRNDRIAALYDRFQFKVAVEAVASTESRLAVLERAEAVAHYAPAVHVSLAELKAAATAVRAVEVPKEIRLMLCHIQTSAQTDGVAVSDRRLTQWFRALQASAWLNGRTVAGVNDVDVVVWMAWDDEKDIAPMSAIVSRCDTALVKEAVDALNAVNQRFTSVSGNKEQLARLVDEMTAVASRVATQLKLPFPIFRPSGRERVMAAMMTLKSNLENAVTALEG